MKIVSIQQINQEITDIKTQISQIKADQKVIERYASNSSEVYDLLPVRCRQTAYDLLIEMKNHIEKLERRIATIEAYRAKHHQ
jgi:phage shock protein A